MIMQYKVFDDSLIKVKPYPIYNSNNFGYRTHDFTEENFNQPHWYVLGESNTFGIGIKNGERFSDRLEQQLGDLVFNLARPGSSGEECVRILYGFTETQQIPKGIIVVWPYLVRRNFYSISKSHPVYLTGSYVDKSMTKHLINNTDDMNIAYFFNQMYFVEHWAKQKNTQCYHFMVAQKDIVMLQDKSQYTDKICPAGFSHCATATDKAEDGAHFGPLHHKSFVHTVESWIKSR